MSVLELINYSNTYNYLHVFGKNNCHLGEINTPIKAIKFLCVNIETWWWQVIDENKSYYKAHAVLVHTSRYNISNEN